MNNLSFHHDFKFSLGTTLVTDHAVSGYGYTHKALRGWWQPITDRERHFLFILIHQVALTLSKDKVYNQGYPWYNQEYINQESILGIIILWMMMMNRTLGHLCVHIGQTGPGEPPEYGEMIEMTLFSRHRIRNSSPGGLRPSTLPLGHGGSPQYWLSHVDGEETFLFLSNRRDREPNPELWRERQRC